MEELQCDFCERKVGPQEPIWRAVCFKNRKTKTACAHCWQREVPHLDPTDENVFQMLCRGCYRPGPVVVGPDYLVFHQKSGVYCSTRCARLLYSRKAEAKRNPRHLKYIKVKYSEIRCAVCRNPFLPKRSDRLYCSDACNHKAYRERKMSGQPKADSPGAA